MPRKDGGGEYGLVSNQGRVAKVEARERENAPMHFFHVSPHKFKVGELIVPEPGSRHVFLADSPVPHFTIAHERVLPDPEIRQARIDSGTWNPEWDGGWHSYEVEPVGPLLYGAENEELRCTNARVLQDVGDARTILKHHEERLRKHGINPDKEFVSSRVLGVEQVRSGGHEVKGRGKNFWRHYSREFNREK